MWVGAQGRVPARRPRRRARLFSDAAAQQRGHDAPLAVAVRVHQPGAAGGGVARVRLCASRSGHLERRVHVFSRVRAAATRIWGTHRVSRASSSSVQPPFCWMTGLAFRL
jgi:hypothetical protein